MNLPALAFVGIKVIYPHSVIPGGEEPGFGRYMRHDKPLQMYVDYIGASGQLQVTEHRVTVQPWETLLLHRDGSITRGRCGNHCFFSLPPKQFIPPITPPPDINHPSIILPPPEIPPDYGKIVLPELPVIGPWSYEDMPPPTTGIPPCHPCSPPPGTSSGPGAPSLPGVPAPPGYYIPVGGVPGRIGVVTGPSRVTPEPASWVLSIGPVVAFFVRRKWRRR